MTGLAVGGFKGVKGFVEGIFGAVSSGPKGDSKLVAQLREQSDISAAQLAAYQQQQAQMQAQMDITRQQRVTAQEAVADPNAPDTNAAKLAAKAAPSPAQSLGV